MKVHKILLYSAFTIVGGFLLCVLYYLIFALCFSTDLEKQLEEENARYRESLPELEADVALLEGEIDYLKKRDAEIYKRSFKIEIPSMFNYPERDNISDVMESAARTEANWREIYSLLNSPRYTLPPVFSPIENLEYINVGASVGEKINPFYKMPIRHDGVDLVAPAGTPVHAVAGGLVTAVDQITGGKGTVVEITHSNGYVSRYAHLQEALVKKKTRVFRGDVIGLVGDSGRAFSTHLHYELEKDGQVLDPVYFFFDSNDPLSYYNMLVMSVVSRQSLD